MSLDAHYARAQATLREAREQIARDIPDPAPDVHCPHCGALMSVMRGRHTQTWWVWHPHGFGVDPCRLGNRNFRRMPSRAEAVTAFEEGVRAI